MAPGQEVAHQEGREKETLLDRIGKDLYRVWKNGGLLLEQSQLMKRLLWWAHLKGRSLQCLKHRHSVGKESIVPLLR